MCSVTESSIASVKESHPVLELNLYLVLKSGAPLFSTKYRFNSKTGWLSFTEAIKDSVTEHMDYSYGMVRVEIRSKSSGIHLGHVFNDGPNGKPRYCINATVLEFKENI